MKKLKIINYVVCILLFLTFVTQTANAKNPRWREIRNKIFITFDWNCSKTESFPKRSLRRLVRKAIAAEDRSLPGAWGDRAFVLKLNAQNNAVYFVPLVCGATGNCSWGLYSTNPVKSLGQIHGEFIYTYINSGGWPVIVTYMHMSAAEGTLSTYVVRKGRYEWRGDK